MSFHNDPADIVPAKPIDLREKIDAAYAAGVALSAQLMALCAAALGLPLDYFKAAYETPDCTLRVAYYPHVTPAPAGATGAQRVTSQAIQTIYDRLSCLRWMDCL